MKTFAMLVKDARNLHGLTRKELAALCDVEETTIKNIENGVTRSTNFYTTVRICAALGIALDEAAGTCLYENLPRNLHNLPPHVRRRLEVLRAQAPVASSIAP